MKLYKTGYIVATIHDYKKFSYSAWPLSKIRDDIEAEKLTDEADDNWFTLYDMPEIAPNLDYVKRYTSYCKNIGLATEILLIETPLGNFEVDDKIEDVIEYGYDCIGGIDYSFLREEKWNDDNSLEKENITLNSNGLFSSLEDAEKLIAFRQKLIASGVNLENYWKEILIKISKVIVK